MKNSIRSSRVDEKCSEIIYGSVQPVLICRHWRVLLSHPWLPPPHTHTPSLAVDGSPAHTSLSGSGSREIGELTSQELHLKSRPGSVRQTLGAFRGAHPSFRAAEPLVCLKWHVVKNLSADASGLVCFEQNNNNVHICSPFHLVILKPQVHIN